MPSDMGEEARRLFNIAVSNDNTVDRIMRMTKALGAIVDVEVENREDEIEKLLAALNTIRVAEHGPSEGLLHGNWQMIKEVRGE